jgi:hypothetical protein
MERGIGGAHFDAPFSWEGDEMRITMKRFETENKVKTGMFSSSMVKSYVVQAHVELSETELAVIRTQRLGDAVIFERTSMIGPSEYTYKFKISDLIEKKMIGNSFHTPIEANNYEQELKTSILPNLKSYIEGNIAPEEKSETFDL